MVWLAIWCDDECGEVVGDGRMVGRCVDGVDCRHDGRLTCRQQSSLDRVELIRRTEVICGRMVYSEDPTGRCNDAGVILMHWRYDGNALSRSPKRV